jgi:hypothetical protein
VKRSDPDGASIWVAGDLTVYDAPRAYPYTGRNRWVVPRFTFVGMSPYSVLNDNKVHTGDGRKLTPISRTARPLDTGPFAHPVVRSPRCRPGRGDANGGDREARCAPPSGR